MASQRLNKVIAHAGIASRRSSEELIRQGHISVNGEITLVPQTLVDLSTDVIAFDGKRIKLETKVYYLLHKPVGYTCTNAPGKKRAIDLLGLQKERLYTVGRLDRDTSGLIIITNDGEFANNVMHPSKRIPKEYLVKVDKEVQHEHLVTIAEGMWIEGSYVKPKSVVKVRRGTLRIVVVDGRKHEVRRLMEKAGLETRDLKRIRIGQLVLGTLPAGHFRPLSEKERELILKTKIAKK